MLFGLSETALKTIVDIISKYEQIEEAIVFGSRVRETHKANSDIDIAIKGRDIDIMLAALIKTQLEEDTNIPVFFDIILYDTIDNDNLKSHIDNEGKTIFHR